MSEHTPTPWRNLNLFSVSVPKGTGLGSLAGDEMLALACVNAFHSPDGRKIATEDIGEGVVFQLRDALNQMQNWACKFESMLEYESLKDEKQFGKEHGEARALLSSLKIQEPDS